jgi:hypothetical protein
MLNSIVILQYSVLGCLGDAELENRLRRNMDAFAGGRVASHAGGAVNFHELADSRNSKPICGACVRESGETFEGIFCLCFTDVSLFCDCCDDL